MIFIPTKNGIGLFIEKMNKDLGNLISKNIPFFFEEEDVSDVRERILKNVANYETINYVYVFNKEDKLSGVSSIKVILDRAKEGFLFDIMEENPVRVYFDEDQENVVRLALKHNIKSVPVVDRDDKFLGIVTSDTILKILNEEQEEDIFLSKGFLVDKPLRDINNATAKQLVLLRTPWLLLGLFGGVIAARIIGAFEATITALISLSFFIPIIVYLSDAVSTQSATIFIRGMSKDNNISVPKYFLRELKVGSVMGVILGLILSFISYIGWSDIRLAIILLFSVFFGVIFSVIFAILIPLILLKIGKDPAVGTNPLATIISDILSIFFYFLISSIILSFFY